MPKIFSALFIINLSYKTIKFTELNFMKKMRNRYFCSILGILELSIWNLVLKTWNFDRLLRSCKNITPRTEHGLCSYWSSLLLLCRSGFLLVDVCTTQDICFGEWCMAQLWGVVAQSVQSRVQIRHRTKLQFYSQFHPITRGLRKALRVFALDQDICQ